MRARTLALAAAAGVAAFLLVTVAVTELALPYIAFSVLVGLPVGVVAGLTAFAFVVLGLAENATPRRRRAARGLGLGGVGFLVCLVVLAGPLGVRNSVALLVAAGLGLLVGALGVVTDGSG